jgi:hypothetical protein
MEQKMTGKIKNRLCFDEDSSCKGRGRLLCVCHPFSSAGLKLKERKLMAR